MRRTVTALISAITLGLGACSSGEPESTPLSDPTVEFVGTADPAWESGAVAAAATQVDVDESALLDEGCVITLDSPFDYQVVEQRTGLVLFAGRVADPS